MKERVYLNEFNPSTQKALIKNVAKLYDEGMTNPKDIGEAINKPDYLVVDVLEKVQRAKRIKQDLSNNKYLK